MVHSYLEVVQFVDKHVCPECNGLSYIDDLELGDISGHMWPCTACNSTGFKNGQFSLHVIIDKPSRKDNDQANLFAFTHPAIAGVIYQPGAICCGINKCPCKGSANPTTACC